MEALNSLEMFPPINQLENILSTTTVQGDITNETDNNKMVDPTSPIPQKRAKRAVRTVSVSFCIYIYYLQYILRVSSFPFNFQFLSLSIYNLLQFWIWRENLDRRYWVLARNRQQNASFVCLHFYVSTCLPTIILTNIIMFYKHHLHMIFEPKCTTLLHAI